MTADRRWSCKYLGVELKYLFTTLYRCSDAEINLWNELRDVLQTGIEQDLIMILSRSTRTRRAKLTIEEYPKSEQAALFLMNNRHRKQW